MIYIIKDKLYNAITHQGEPTVSKRGYPLLLHAKNCLVLKLKKKLWSVWKQLQKQTRKTYRLSNYMVSLNRRQLTALRKLEIDRRY